MVISKQLDRRLKRIRRKTPHMKYVYGWHYKHARIRKNTILIESFHGKTIGDSGLVFAKEIARLYPKKYKVYYATEKPEEHGKLVKELGLDVELINIATFKYCRILATAEYIISNASLPIYFIRKDGQKYMQTWHGTPLKTLGKEMREGVESMYNVQHNFLQASYITFPNEFTREVIMRDYNLERLYTGEVVMSGYPRNSVFLSDADTQSIRKSLGNDDKVVYAYMPTWRGKNNKDIDVTDYLNEVGRIFAELDREMTDDQLMYVNFHPILRGSMSFDEYKHILPFPTGIDSYEFLNSVDALVTDYSSVFFDFSLTRKPIVLFMYDYEEYMSERGMYMDVANLPFRQIYKVEEFCKCIVNGECLDDKYDDSEFFATFFKYDSADCTEKLLELILNDKREGLEIDDYSGNSDTELTVYLPDKVKSESEFRTMAKVTSGPDDVVMLYRKWFKRDIGLILHDKYNDAFNYVITANTPPRTYIEQILAKLGSKKHERIIRERDIARTFPGLKVNDYTVNYGYIKEGYKVDLATSGEIEADVNCEGNGVITFNASLPEKVKFKQVAILDNGNSIVQTRDITDEELASGRITYEMKPLIESLTVYNKEYATPGLIAEAGSGKKRFYTFRNSAKAPKAKKAFDKKNATGRAFTPDFGTYQLPQDYAIRNFRELRDSLDDYERGILEQYNTDPVDTNIFIVPSMSFFRESGEIRLAICTEDRAILYISDTAKLRGYRFNDRGFTIRAFMPGWDAKYVTGGALILDSNAEKVSIPMIANARNVSGGCKVELKMALTDDIPLMPIRWHCRIELTIGEHKHYLRIRAGVARAIKNRFEATQANLKDGYVLFPYIGNGNILKMCYRLGSEYDGRDIKRREVAALILYGLLGPYYRRKNIYVIYEKFCQTAQDNSLYFFRYCMENLKGKERDKFYYIIDKKSPDYKNIAEYESNVIQFMSLKHMIYTMAAKVCISTDSTAHLYTWQSKPSYVRDKIHDKGVLFLQHGVTAMKRVDKLFGKKGSSPMKYFVTTSDTEQRIVVQEFGYVKNNAPIVGFARWDVLADKKDENDKIILVMPTWRQWLEDVDDETFLQSDYYRNYMELLESERLGELLEKGDARVILYLHPKFAGYINTFRKNISDRIEFVAFGERPLNDIMMQCHLLVTDYSSVCWDVLYMDKPVIFYQFDSDRYLSVHGSYINFEKDLPGSRETECEQVLNRIEEYINTDFAIREEHKAMIPRYFAYRDNQNCERTYKFLIDREENVTR